MKVEVDLNKCQGYANCIVEAPEIFDLDEENGKAVVVVEEVPESAQDDALRAVANCPVTAIRVTG